jgi:CO/xanthine dehydrogenase FAD-binding subunit
VKPAPFGYLAPRSRHEAVEALREFGADAKILAGGQSLVPLLAMRLARPSVLVDINRIRDLSFIRVASGEMVIGAMTRQRQIETHRLVTKHAPLLRDAVRWIGHPQIRTRGTLGGSLAHADPAAELPAVALVLGAHLVLTSVRGKRTVAGEEFFTGYLSTAMEPDELLTEVRVPVQPPDAGWAFLEVARRRGDFALVGVAVLLRADAARRISEARMACVGVGAGPVRLQDAERFLVGRTLEGPTTEELAQIVRKGIDPPSDIHASADYRRHVAGVLAARAVVQAAARLPSQEVR